MNKPMPLSAHVKLFAATMCAIVAVSIGDAFADGRTLSFLLFACAYAYAFAVLAGVRRGEPVAVS